MSDKKKLVVVLAHNANDDKPSVGFTIANAALSGGMEVAVFLTSDGVELARDGSCDLTLVQPFKKLDELIDGFLEKGGTVWACTPCYQHRGLDPAHNCDRVIVTGAGPLIEWVQARHHPSPRRDLDDLRARRRRSERRLPLPPRAGLRSGAARLRRRRAGDAARRIDRIVRGRSGAPA